MGQGGTADERNKRREKYGKKRREQRQNYGYGEYRRKKRRYNAE